MRSPHKRTLTALGLGLLAAGRALAGPPSAPAAQPPPPAKPAASPAAAKPAATSAAAKPAATSAAAKPAASPAAKPTVTITKPPAPSTAKPVAPVPAPAVIPDYGGRDSAPLAVGDNAPNPLAQAGRALEALLLVLAGIVGVTYALKRYGLVTPGRDGKPARIAFPSGLGRLAPNLPSASSPVTVVSSQALPGGAMLHVVSVRGRTLLLAATAHAVTPVAEWPEESEPSDEAAAFEAYLERADAVSPIGAANARLRSLLSRPQPGDLP